MKKKQSFLSPSTMIINITKRYNSLKQALTRWGAFLQWIWFRIIVSYVFCALRDKSALINILRRNETIFDVGNWRERKCREWISLHFLIFSPFPLHFVILPPFSCSQAATICATWSRGYQPVTQSTATVVFQIINTTWPSQPSPQGASRHRCCFGFEELVL